MDDPQLLGHELSGIAVADNNRTPTCLLGTVDSGDTILLRSVPVTPSGMLLIEIVHRVLLHLRKHLSLRDLLRLIEDGGKSLAPANRLYAREHNKKILDGWKLQFSLRGKPAS